jgi:hypothetical protein
MLNSFLVMLFELHVPVFGVNLGLTLGWLYVVKLCLY